MTRSLGKTLRRGQFEVRVDTAFARVIEACGSLRAQTTGTWITPQMQAAYCRLHELGYAHSVESWQDGQLVGGLYGVALDRAFFGESMFSTVSDASKVALVHLSQRLEQRGFGVRITSYNVCYTKLLRSRASASRVGPACRRRDGHSVHRLSRAQRHAAISRGGASRWCGTGVLPSIGVRAEAGAGQA